MESIGAMLFSLAPLLLQHVQQKTIFFRIMQNTQNRENIEKTLRDP